MGLASRRQRVFVFGLLLGVLLAVGRVNDAHAFVYWANLGLGGTTIGRATQDGGTPTQGFITGASGPCGVAVNGSHIYWANSSSSSIGRAGLDGGGANQSLITGVQNGPCGVAVDSDHVYWATGGGGTKIGRASLDGSNTDHDFITGVSPPCGVAVDGAHVYWAHSSPSGIGRADLDGGNVNHNFIPVPLGNPCGVAVDGYHVYWGNGTKAVGRADLDGGNVNQSFIGPTSSYVCGVAVDSTHIYWSNGGFLGTTIGRANLDGTGMNDSFLTGSDRACGVATDLPPLAAPVVLPPVVTPPATTTTAVSAPNAPAPVPAPPATIDQLVKGLPSTKRCLSRRSFTIRLAGPKGLTVTKATVYVNGTRTAVRTGARLLAPVNLKGLPKGRFKVKITLQTGAGGLITGTRTYRTCATRKKAAGN